VFGAPLGISFFGTAFSEPTLIKLASGYEAFTHIRANNLPTFSPTVPFTNIQGTTPGVSPAAVSSASTVQPAPTRKKMPHHL
jgi:hypothetical protein